MSLLSQKLTSKKYYPKFVCEIGVWHPETSNIKTYIDSGVKTMLVEPDPESIELIKEKWSNKSNLILKEFACADFEGSIDLYKAGSSSFISSSTSSPAIINDSYHKEDSPTVKVKAKKFSSEDPGNIDLISIDIEGSEWFVIKNMISRPNVVSIETHGALYVNPFKNEINNWMNAEGYKIWYKDNSDTVYVKRGSIKLTIIENAFLLLKNIHLSLRRLEKFISIILKKIFLKK